MGFFNTNLLLVALGFLFIDFFGNFYNDYWDFEEDVKNKRKDKFTTSGIISKKATLNLSVLFALMGILVLFNTVLLIAILGTIYLFSLFLYSHKWIRLKGKVIGYMIISFPFLILPSVLAHAYDLVSQTVLPLSIFFFTQYTYILCQKDSTDIKEKNNIFVSQGWEESSNITAFFALLASLSLFLLSLNFIPLIFIWFLNLSSKFLNLNKIRHKTITRLERSKLIFIEFLTHYLIVAMVLA